mgnify:CR=1 FL=1
MELDQLKNQWRKEMEMTSTSKMPSFEELKHKVVKLDRSIYFRDFGEISVAALMIAVLSYRLLAHQIMGTLTQIGTGFLILTCVFIIYKLLKTRLPSGNDDWIISSRITSEITKLEKQIQLTSNILPWYLMPIFISIVLITLGAEHERTGSYFPNTFLVYYYMCCVLLGGVIYWLNLRVAKKKFGPILDELRKLQKELESNI